MLNTYSDPLAFELLLIDIGSFFVGYLLFKEDRRLSLNYVISQLLGSIFIIASLLLGATPYDFWSRILLVVGFLAKVGIFPFVWMHPTILRTKALTNLLVCSHVSIILFIARLNRDGMSQGALLALGLLACFFSAINALYEKKTKSSIASIITAQTAYAFTALFFLPFASTFIAVLSDLLAKFTMIFSEEKKDDIAQILAAVYLAELPPFPTFSEEFEILERSMNVGVALNIASLLMMVALLTHRVKGGKSLGARMVGAVLLAIGFISFIKNI